VRAAHELYGKALGMTGALAVAVKLAAPLRKVQEAIVNYGIARQLQAPAAPSR